MGLSDEDRKRIEEEEYRRALREKYERELRGKAEVRADTTHQVDVRGVSAHFVQADTSHQVEVRGVTTEIYRDAKQGVAAAGRGLARAGYYLGFVAFCVTVAVLVVAVIGGVLLAAPLTPIGISGIEWVIVPVAFSPLVILGVQLWKWFRKPR